MWGLAVTADQVLQKWWQEPWIQCMYRRKKDLDAWFPFESWPMSTIEVWLVGCCQPCLVCAWHFRAARRLSTWIYAHVDGKTALGIYWIAVKRGLDQQFVEGAVDGKSQEVGRQERQWRSRLPDFGGEERLSWLCRHTMHAVLKAFFTSISQSMKSGKGQRAKSRGPLTQSHGISDCNVTMALFRRAQHIYSQWPRWMPDRGHDGSRLKPPAPLMISVYLALCAHRSGVWGDHMLGWSYAFLTVKGVWNGRLTSDAMRQKKKKKKTDAMCFSHGCEAL